MGVQAACEECGSEATVCCSSCHLGNYCSGSHCQQVWDTHRQHCCPVVERSDPTAGRFLVTSREVPAGELLLTEVAIAVGPRATSPLVCLGCHQLIPGAEFPRCAACWWPLCSEACASSSLHRAECRILAADTSRLGQPRGPGSTPRYDVILVLRCLLLRDTDPAAWRRLQDMASHAKRRQQEREQHHMTTVLYIKDVLKADYDLQDIHHARGAIVTNCFEWRSPSGVSLRGVYPVLGRMNHACRPTVAITADSEGTMWARAAVDLQGGDHLYNTYTGTLQTLWQRRAYTTEAHFFTCCCVRCADPTELGLHYSSPRCEQCDHQYLEPRTWLGEMTWECPMCGLQQQEQLLRQEVEQWLEHFNCDDTFLHTSPHAVRNILDKLEEVFHPHHHVWVTAAQAAIRTLQENRSRQALALKKDLWRRLLHIYDILEPGLTRRRGVTLYEVGVAEADIARAEKKAEDLTEYFFKLQMQQALRHLQQAICILSLEPPRSSERRWYDRARDAAAAVVQDLSGEELPDHTKQDFGGQELPDHTKQDLDVGQCPTFLDKMQGHLPTYHIISS
nr:SET domain-containing protein SmydA-8-like [Procambarus clarkii]XP_045583668.1 SET domain-containing protein SmydA-8-like [Procambarus clarkii]